MTRELSKLRQVNAELEARLAGEATKPLQKRKEKEVQESALHAVKINILGGSSTMTSRKNGDSSRSRERRDVNWTGIVPPDPEPSLLLELRRENEELRARLGNVEKDYARVKRLNEVYREELIVRRGRVRFISSCLFSFPSTIIINCQRLCDTVGTASRQPHRSDAVCPRFV